MASSRVHYLYEQRVNETLEGGELRLRRLEMGVDRPIEDTDDRSGQDGGDGHG
jgi:hypothetical protein